MFNCFFIELIRCSLFKAVCENGAFYHVYHIFEQCSCGSIDSLGFL